MATALRGHVLEGMPTQSGGHGTHRFMLVAISQQNLHRHEFLWMRPVAAPPDIGLYRKPLEMF